MLLVEQKDDSFRGPTKGEGQRLAFRFNGHAFVRSRRQTALRRHDMDMDKPVSRLVNSQPNLSQIVFGKGVRAPIATPLRDGR